MPKFGAIKLRDLIKSLRKYGFDGPYAGGKHPFMMKGDLSIYTKTGLVFGFSPKTILRWV